MSKDKVAYLFGMVIPPIAYALLAYSGVIAQKNLMPVGILFALFMVFSLFGFKGWLTDPWA